MSELDEQHIEVLLERAAKAGAREALESIGLHDEKAVNDVRDLRDLLDAWRQARKTVWKTVVHAMTMAVLGAILTGVVLNVKSK